MVLFAALTLVRALDVLRAVALAVRAGTRVGLRLRRRDHGRVAWVVERLVLRPLVNQEGIILFMATIGITYLPRRLRPDRVGQRRLHARHRHAEGPDDHPRERVPRRHPGQRGRPRARRSIAGVAGRGARAVLPEDRASAARCARSPTTIRRRSRSAFRSTASGSSSGRSPASSRWSPGIIWGSKLGVQFSISLVALKALPVLILGGFTSVPGAIVGGLIIGVGEKLAEVFLGPVARRRHRELVRLRAGAALPAGPAAGPVRREASSSGSETACSTARPASSRPATPPTRRSFRSCRTASSCWSLLAVRLRRRAARWRATICFARS